VALTGLAAGFHAVAYLPAGASERDVIGAARARAVGPYGMSTHRAGHSAEPPQLVLGFGNTGQRAIRAGIVVLGDILASPALRLRVPDSGEDGAVVAGWRPSRPRTAAAGLTSPVPVSSY
jgi:GntR family transcriptional regulator/MocR family aminotransferase